MFAFFERLLEPFPKKDLLPPPNTLFAFFRYYTKGSITLLLAMAVLTGAIAIIEVSLFGFLGQLVDWLNQHTPATLFEESKATLVFMAILVLIILPLIVLLHSLLIHQSLLGNFPMAVRWQAHRFLLGQSISFYQNELAGRLATKVMQTALAVRETVLKLVDIMLYVVIYFGGVIVLVAHLDLRLAVPFMVWGAAYCYLLYLFLPKLEKISMRQADARSEMTGRIVDTYTNIMTVKLFSHAQRESDYARGGMQRFLASVYPQMRLATGLHVSVWMINSVLIFAVATLSIWLWSKGAISSGAIAAAVGLVLRLYGMSQRVMWEVSALFENIGTARDGMNTLSRPRQLRDEPDAKILTVEGGRIEFDCVRFRYYNEPQVIENFSLVINAGEKIGLVGRSGAGKSTLVNLLLRFYDLEEGQILIDGQNVSRLQQESLRSHIALVTQDSSLLHRSVWDNLIYGKPSATKEEVVSAAIKAEAHEFITALRDSEGRRGYDAHVGERGVKLSGGQKQRIAIARVLLKDAPILVLDEATSALDSEVEAAIQENLFKLMEGKTVIAIAHRLSTIAALDKLVVVDQGNIVEQGTHAELLMNKGIYAQLWEHQSGGFLGER